MKLAVAKVAISLPIRAIRRLCTRGRPMGQSAATIIAQIRRKTCRRIHSIPRAMAQTNSSIDSSGLSPS